MEIENILTENIVNAISALYGTQITTDKIQLQKTRKEFEGDFTLVVFPFLSLSRKRPEETAKEIGEYLAKEQSLVTSYNVIKGFLNLSIDTNYWIDLLQTIEKTEKWGITPISKDSPLVMVEYSSPNTNKPLHLGHIRNNLLGYALANIIEANGNRVVKTNIVNDRGIHICKSMLAWQKWGNGETPENSGKKGDHLIGDYYVAFDKHYKAEINEAIEKGATKEEAEASSALMAEAREMLVKWESGDADVRNLWKTMNGWVYEGFDETYRTLGVNFDKIYYESDTYIVGKETVLNGLEKGIFYRREDESVWADLTKDGLDEKLLLRSDGTSVYMTQDIGTAQLRFRDYPIDKMVYVVGNEQNYHFQVLSLLLDKLGFSWGKDLVHFSYGMVELPEGKMKSREGTVVDADDLMQEMFDTARETSIELGGKLNDLTPEEAEKTIRTIGLGALKYFMLKVDARKNMLFNPKESIDFNGNTGPFIQYTYARTRSIERKAAESGINTVKITAPAAISDKERSIIRQLYEFPAIVRQAGNEYSPSVIANYAYELAKEYNQFYHDFSILRENDEILKAFRIQLTRNVGKVIKTAMNLLGIDVPEKM